MAEHISRAEKKDEKWKNARKSSVDRNRITVFIFRFLAAKRSVRICAEKKNDKNSVRRG